MYGEHKEVYILSISAGNFNPQIPLDSISLSLVQTSFLDLCKYLTGCPILLTASLLEPFFLINPATSINFQGNLSMVPLLTGQTQTSWEDTFKAFYNLSPTSLVRCFFKKKLFIYLFMAALGLRCCMRAFSSRSERGLLFVAVCGLLTAVACLCCGARVLGTWASVVVAHGLSSCSSWALERGLSSCGTQA